MRTHAHIPSSPAGLLQAFPLSRCGAMGEGARRVGEGPLFQRGMLVEINAHCTKEPSSGLRPPSPTLTRGRRGKLVRFAGEGKEEVVCSATFPVALSLVHEVAL